MMTYHFPFNPEDTLYQVITHRNGDKEIEPVTIHKIIIDKNGVAYIDNVQQKLFRGDAFGKELFDSQYEAFKQLTKECKLPCKIGTKLYGYKPFGSGIIPTIMPITISKITKENGQIYLVDDNKVKYSIAQIGESIFFSEEKAEESIEEKFKQSPNFYR